MTQSCPNCGSLNREGYRFCSTCGTRNPVLDAPAASAAETAGTPAYAVQSWDDEQQDVARTDSLGAYVPPQVPGSVSPSLATPSASSSQAPYGPRGAYDARDLPPIEADRPREATYAPYTETAVRQIERSEGKRSWLMPVVVLSGLVLIVLAGVALYLYVTPGNG
jgi:cobalamin biosynthesis Mg chelatase CobN